MSEHRIQVLTGDKRHCDACGGPPDYHIHTLQAQGCPVRHGQPHTWVTTRGAEVCGSCGAGSSRGSSSTTGTPPRLTVGQSKAYEAITEAGALGLTIAEYARDMGRFPNEVSGRFSELKDMGVIRRLPARRGNGAVWVAV